MNSLANLYAVFRTLQPELRAWLTSEEAMAVIETIATTFVLSKAQERQLPLLILRLVTQDTPPESFKSALAERLGVSRDIAQNIAQAMREGIFSPVEQALRFNGVDTSAIGLDAPLTSMPVPPPPAPAPMPTPMPPPSTPPPITTPPSQKPAPEPAPVPTPPPPSPTGSGGQVPPKPFVLHAEPKASAPEPVKPSFSFTPPSPTGSGSQRAPKVIIERVVHYGALTTPLTTPCGLRRAGPQKPTSDRFS